MFFSQGIRNYYDTRWSKAVPVAKMSKTQLGKDPIAAILCKLAGLDSTRKRGRTPAQMWMKERFGTVKKEFDEEFSGTGKDSRRGRINEVASFAQDLFSDLSAADQTHWKKRAEEDAQEVAEGKANAQEHLSLLSPSDTQAYVSLPHVHRSLMPLVLFRALDSLAGTLQPLLEGLSTVLGGNISFSWCGPEPRKGGQVNVVT